MSYANPDALVETDWLAENLSDPKVKVLDASYHLPGTNRDAEAEFEDRHIPGAMLFDIEEVRDLDNSLPHMLPSAKQFAAQMSTLGISSENMVVVYDVHGVQTAPRAWWTFRAFGHNKFAILNGGLPKWITENRPLSDDIVDGAHGNFHAETVPALVRNVDQMLSNQQTREALVVDARPEGRCNAAAPEPRPGLRAGRMPGSVNLPVNLLVDPASKTFLPADKIRAALSDAGVADPNQPMITTCGSGVAACVVSLGLYLIGNETVPVYDGSWSEWGARDDTPIEA